MRKIVPQSQRRRNQSFRGMAKPQENKSNTSRNCKKGIDIGVISRGMFRKRC